MAIFNPKAEEHNDPNYLSQSKPISDFQGDTSLGTALKGVGDVFKAGVGAGDTYVKKDIENEIYAAVDSERDNYTSSLTKSDIDTALNTRTDDTKGQPLTLVAQNEEKLPSDVQKIGQYAENIKAGYEAGNYGKTYYDGRLLSIAKSMRAKYPGYRDYIDQQISQVTGINPANQYINDIRSDLHNASQAAKTEANKIDTLVRQNLEVKGVPELYAAHKANPNKVSELDIMKVISDHKVLKETLDINQKLRENQKGNVADNKANADLDANTYGKQMVETAFSTTMMTSGLGTPQDTFKFITDAMEGKINIDSVQAQKAGEGLKAAGAKFKIDYAKEMDKRGVTALLGPEEIKKRAQAFADRFDEVGDLVYNEKWGPAAMAANRTKGLLADAKLGIVTDSEIGETAKLAATMKDIGGETWATQLWTQVLKNNIDLRMKNYIESRVNKVSVQPDKATGQPLVLRDIYEDARKRAQSAKLEHEVPRVNEAVLSTALKVVNDPTADPEIKKNNAMALYHPNNQGFIASIQRDGVRENGTIKPGRFSVYNRMFNDVTAANIKSLNDPEISAMYVNSAKQMFGFELFSKELAQLREMQATPGVKIGWDDENNRWTATGPGIDSSMGVIRTKTARRPGEIPAGEARQDMQSLNLLNSGIYSLSKAAGVAGESVDGFIINTMIQLGFDPTKGSTSIPDQMIEAIKNSKLKQQMKMQQGTDGKRSEAKPQDILPHYDPALKTDPVLPILNNELKYHEDKIKENGSNTPFHKEMLDRLKKQKDDVIKQYRINQGSSESATV